MRKDKWQLLMERILPSERVLVNEPMARHTTMQVGGPARVMVLPASAGEVSRIVKAAKEENIPYLVIGKGSNLIVRDGGFNGLVIKLSDPIGSICIEQEQVKAQAGASLSGLAKLCGDEGLSGLEFASGIPGTLGGAVVMNAGAYGHEICEVLTLVEYVDEYGNIFSAEKGELAYGYRESLFLHRPWIVTAAGLKLSRGDRDQIKNHMAELARKRRQKQPLQFPSAGSVFKRPPGAYAAQLIEEAGLKGCTVGKAQVSPLHAGFIVNMGGASARDVLSLLELVQAEVWKKCAVRLEPEVRIVGEETV